MTGNIDTALSFTTTTQSQIDHVEWTAGRSFSAYGLRLGLRANDLAALAAATVYDGMMLVRIVARLAWSLAGLCLRAFHPSLPPLA